MYRWRLLAYSEGPDLTLWGVPHMSMHVKSKHLKVAEGNSISMCPLTVRKRFGHCIPWRHRTSDVTTVRLIILVCAFDYTVILE